MQADRNEAPSGARRRTENHYCSHCMRTQSFLDRGRTLRCPVCGHRLWRRERE